MRGVLDRLYDSSHWLACAALCTIAALVIIQVGARILDTLLQAAGIPPIGFIIPSLAEFAGFLMVGATFLALASTLRHGVHIRVTVVLGILPARVRRVFNVLATAAGALLFLFVSWHALLLALDSYQVGSLSYGIIPVPLWIPQGVMTLGFTVFAVALLDEAWHTVRVGSPTFEDQHTNVLDDAG